MKGHFSSFVLHRSTIVLHRSTIVLHRSLIVLRWSTNKTSPLRTIHPASQPVFLPYTLPSPYAKAHQGIGIEGNALQ